MPFGVTFGVIGPLQPLLDKLWLDDRLSQIPSDMDTHTLKSLIINICLDPDPISIQDQLITLLGFDQLDLISDIIAYSTTLKEQQPELFYSEQMALLETLIQEFQSIETQL